MADENKDEPTQGEGKPKRTERLQRGEIRARFPEQAFELRAEEDDGTVVLQGYVAPFNEWTEIDSLFEGRFMERIAPTAFNKALQERRPKVLFQHGHDPSIGDKPIGVPRLIEPRERGEWYEVDLFAETSYVADLLPAMRAGELGTSFRFTSIKEEFDREPGDSDHNPDGIPERTVIEATLPEFGPVTFPAYEGATANIRSVLTEEHFIVAERTATVSNEEPEPITSEPEPTPSLGGSRKRRRDYLGATQAAPWKI